MKCNSLLTDEHLAVCKNRVPADPSLFVSVVGSVFAWNRTRRLYAYNVPRQYQILAPSLKTVKPSHTRTLLPRNSLNSNRFWILSNNQAWCFRIKEEKLCPNFLNFVRKGSTFEHCKQWQLSIPVTCSLLRPISRPRPNWPLGIKLPILFMGSRWACILLFFFSKFTVCIGITGVLLLVCFEGLFFYVLVLGRSCC